MARKKEVKCPYCRSKKTTKDGMKPSGSKMKQRWYCHNCRRRTVNPIEI